MRWKWACHDRCAHSQHGQRRHPREFRFIRVAAYFTGFGMDGNLAEGGAAARQRNLGEATAYRILVTAKAAESD